MPDPQHAEVIAFLRSFPQLKSWPALGDIIEAYETDAFQVCRLSYHALVAPAERRASLPVEAAICCVYVAGFLIDDIMDGDCTKPEIALDEGRRANLAGALLVAAYDMVLKSDFPDRTRLRICETLSEMLLVASAAQELEMQLLHGEIPNTDPEGNYWKLLRGKSAQQIGFGLKLGAVMADDDGREEPLYEIGVTSGEMFQVFDDIADAIPKKLSPDWDSLSSNLLMLYCSNADHPRRNDFLEHFKNAKTDPAAFDECRRIMIESGALGFAIYNYYDRYLKVKKRVRSLEWHDPSFLLHLILSNAYCLSRFLVESGFELPREIAEDLERTPPPAKAARYFPLKPSPGSLPAV